MTKKQKIFADEYLIDLNATRASAYIQPQKEGTYRFKYIYKIAGETWVDNIKIKTG